MSEVKQVILVRQDLKMRRGKEMAQVAHASMKVFFDLNNSECTTSLRIPLTPEMGEWVHGLFTKVVLYVSSEELLLQAHQIAKEKGLPTSLIKDAGITEFGGKETYTTCAIGPAHSNEIDPITGRDGIIPTKLA